MAAKSEATTSQAGRVRTHIASREALPTKHSTRRLTSRVLQTPIDVIDWPSALDRIEQWAALRESRYVCACNSHSAVTATQDARFRDALAQADMALPDGAPVAWMMRRLGHRQQQRISGPDLMLRSCERAAASGTRIYLLGSRPDTSAALQRRLALLFPALHIAGASSPPFRPLSSAEDQALVTQVNESGAGIVFVSLGCPKQEQWMAEHRGRVHAVMIGVGAAFSFHSGIVERAPAWMQRNALEWLHRLGTEPIRLWKRYLTTNSKFVVDAVRQLLT